MTRVSLTKRLVGSPVLLLFFLFATASSALAECPTTDSISGEYNACTSACETGDLIENMKCINVCIAERMRADDARYACNKAERDAAALSAQERIKKEAAEREKLEKEQVARQAGSSWGAQHGAELVDLGDEASFVNGDVKLMRDGKVVPFQKGTKIGPADVLMTTSLGPVGVGSQVENIRYGKDTIVQRIGMLYNPPRLLEQAGVADVKGLYGVKEEDEWSWWMQLGKDIGSIVTPDLAAMTPLCAKAFAVGQPEICAGFLLGDILVRGGMWFSSTMRSDAGVQFVLTPSAFVMHRETEFTVAVSADNATTVVVLDGSVIVMDMASRKGIILNETQAVSVPKTADGLGAEELGRRVVAINQSFVETFEDAPEASADSSQADGTVAGKSGLSVGILLAGALVVLAAGIVFVVLKSRRAKKK